MTCSNREPRDGSNAQVSDQQSKIFAASAFGLSVLNPGLLQGAFASSKIGHEVLLDAIAIVDRIRRKSM